MPAAAPAAISSNKWMRRILTPSSWPFWRSRASWWTRMTHPSAMPLSGSATWCVVAPRPSTVPSVSFFSTRPVSCWSTAAHTQSLLVRLVEVLVVVVVVTVGRDVAGTYSVVSNCCCSSSVGVACTLSVFNIPMPLSNFSSSLFFCVCNRKN